MGQKNELLCLCVTFFLSLHFVKHVKANVSSYKYMARQAEFKRVKESKRKRILMKNNHKQA